ncbi:branched-chain amino acid transport system substrate-binding protein [Rhizobiales bacterium GAS113]|nr:branched-chain amino acid transport system substrate-binding protein [Rhizobiales bacterium GAS113]
MKRFCFGLAALGAAAWMTAGASRAADSFEINVVLPLTGGASFLGKAEQESLQQYEKVVNAGGGIHGKPLQFVFHDDQTSPQISVQLANEVKASNPAVVLGSAVVALCNAMTPLMRRGPVLYCFSPSINPVAGGYVFSSSISTQGLAGGLLRYFGERGWKKIALITSTDATGQDAYRNIKAMAGNGDHKDIELVAEVQFNPTDVSVAAQIQRLKGANPDAIIAWSTGAPIGTVFKAIRDAGLEVPVGTTDGNMTYAQMGQYASFLPKELFIPSPEWPKTQRPNQKPEVMSAKDAFFKAFEGTDIKPDGPSTFAWDPAVLVVEALRKLKPEASAEELRSYLASLQGFAGINGSYDFKSVPNRGVDESNVVVTRWDPGAGTWVVMSEPGGH